eukprot:COSAG06_NODE_33578_length_487_cov_1.760309_2_plen_69_part_01
MSPACLSVWLLGRTQGMQDRLVMDLHTGSTGGVGLATTFFANTSQSDGGPGAMNLEVNAQFHGMQRALT